MADESKAASDILQTRGVRIKAKLGGVEIEVLHVDGKNAVADFKTAVQATKVVDEWKKS